MLSKLIYQTAVLNVTSSHDVRKALSLLCLGARRLILKIKDPVVKMQINETPLLMNLSHELPLNMAVNPYYNRALVRIAQHLKKKQGDLTMIDVGANVGDTFALINAYVKARFLLIEADEIYYRLLVRNTSKMNKVVHLKALCSEDDGVSTISLARSDGSSHVSAEHHDSLDQIQKLSIDNIVNLKPEFSKTNFMKIDTDGFDYKVIRGSKILLSTQKPAVYFELSPYFLKKANEQPLSIFDFLKDLNYGNALFYDNAGFPVAIKKTDQKEGLAELIEYASYKGTYYDVLTFHDSHTDDLQAFYQSERSYFNNETK